MKTAILLACLLPLIQLITARVYEDYLKLDNKSKDDDTEVLPDIDENNLYTWTTETKPSLYSSIGKISPVKRGNEEDLHDIQRRLYRLNDEKLDDQENPGEKVRRRILDTIRRKSKKVTYELEKNRNSFLNSAENKRKRIKRSVLGPIAQNFGMPSKRIICPNMPPGTWVAIKRQLLPRTIPGPYVIIKNNNVPYTGILRPDRSGWYPLDNTQESEETSVSGVTRPEMRKMKKKFWDMLPFIFGQDFGMPWGRGPPFIPSQPVPPPWQPVLPGGPWHPIPPGGSWNPIPPGGAWNPIPPGLPGIQPGYPPYPIDSPPLTDNVAGNSPIAEADLTEVSPNAFNAVNFENEIPKKDKKLFFPIPIPIPIPKWRRWRPRPFPRWGRPRPWGQPLPPWGQPNRPWGQPLPPWGQPPRPWGQPLPPWGQLRPFPPWRPGWPVRRFPYSMQSDFSYTNEVMSPRGDESPPPKSSSTSGRRKKSSWEPMGGAGRKGSGYSSGIGVSPSATFGNAPAGKMGAGGGVPAGIMTFYRAAKDTSLPEESDDTEVKSKTDLSEIKIPGIAFSIDNDRNEPSKSLYRNNKISVWRQQRNKKMKRKHKFKGRESVHEEDKEKGKNGERSKKTDHGTTSDRESPKINNYRNHGSGVIYR